MLLLLCKTIAIEVEREENGRGVVGETFTDYVILSLLTLLFLPYSFVFYNYPNNNNATPTKAIYWSLILSLKPLPYPQSSHLNPLIIFLQRITWELPKSYHACRSRHWFMPLRDTSNIWRTAPGQVFFLEMELVSAKDAQFQALSERIGTMAGEKLCKLITTSHVRDLDDVGARCIEGIKSISAFI
ncbi:hypothetical protein Tco_0764893 [Tanacetum coccineum]